MPVAFPAAALALGTLLLRRLKERLDSQMGGLDTCVLHLRLEPGIIRATPLIKRVKDDAQALLLAQARRHGGNCSHAVSRVGARLEPAGLQFSIFNILYT